MCSAPLQTRLMRPCLKQGFGHGLSACDRTPSACKPAPRRASPAPLVASTVMDRAAEIWPARSLKTRYKISATCCSDLGAKHFRCGCADQCQIGDGGD
jgi:hypothetical protein